MIHAVELWDAIEQCLKGGRWLPLVEIYRRVEATVRLDPDDFLPSAPGGTEPKWRRNVRNVLQRQKGLGKVLWNGRAAYRLPP